MVRFTQILGGSFRRRLISEIVRIQLESLFSPRPCTKINREKAKWQPPIFEPCLLIVTKRFTTLFK